MFIIIVMNKKILFAIGRIFKNTFKKQIKFGGTFFDNYYENTTIENRIYHFDENNTDGNRHSTDLWVEKTDAQYEHILENI